jgi:NADH dehydrogenase
MQTIAILGGTGFVGSILCEHLVRAGYQLKVLTRARLKARDLWLLPATDCLECNVYDEAALAAAFRDCDVVINLVGILNERGDTGAGFRRAHVDLTRTVLAACTRAGVSRYLHMSSLNASPDGPSHYLRSKGEAERLVQQTPSLHSTIFRPSVIFGAGDGLFQRFADLLRFAPILPLACAAAKMQPVYVGDVAEAFVNALHDNAAIGQRYDLGGPDVMSLHQIVRYVLATTGWHRLVLPLGHGLSRVMAEVMEHLPGKPFSRDNLRSASVDSVVPAEASGLAALGCAQTPVGAIVPGYLGKTSEADKFDRLRQHAHR